MINLQCWIGCIFGSLCILNTANAQVDAGINLAGALLNRAIVLIEFPLDSADVWSLEAGSYYGSSAELREQDTGRVLARERNYGVVLSARRYFYTRNRSGFFAGPWLRAARIEFADRRFDPIRADRRFETSLGILVGYKYLASGRVFIEPVLGAGTVLLSLIEPFGFQGDNVFRLTGDYVVRLRAGYRF